MTNTDLPAICPGCREPWSELPALHFCRPTPSLDDATARPGPRTCLACGLPKGQGYGCVVLPAGLSPAETERGLLEEVADAATRYVTYRPSSVFVSLKTAVHALLRYREAKRG